MKHLWHRVFHSTRDEEIIAIGGPGRISAHPGHRITVRERYCGCTSLICWNCGDELHRWCADAPHLSDTTAAQAP